MGFPGASDGKDLPVIQESMFEPWVRKIPWRGEWQPTPVFLPGEFHGQRSQAGYSTQDHKELDMTKHLTIVIKIFFKVLYCKE